MAVWGTLIATEDDAERAVRAGLDLVAAVTALGEGAGARELALRAGVVTGEAAVTLGAERQGMVAGDLVNTASRRQSAATPGRSWSARRRGAPRRRASPRRSADARVEGQGGAVPPLAGPRVTAGRGGAPQSTSSRRRSSGATANCCSRRTLPRDRGRAAGTPRGGDGDRRHRQVPPGLGVLEVHRGARRDRLVPSGRCLLYGDGIAFWALAEMVRMRPASAKVTTPTRPARSSLRRPTPSFSTTKSVASSSRGSPPPARAREGPARAAGELFARLADLLRTDGRAGPRRPALRGSPVGRLRAGRVRRTPARVVAQPADFCALPSPARSCRAAIPNSGRASHQTTLSLAPLFRAGDARSCSTGSSPDFLRIFATRILARSEGVPLYAVETVRMLLDRGLLSEDEGVYRPTGEVAEPDVPETLHGTHRRPSRRAIRRGAASPPGRVGARQDLHEGVTRRAGWDVRSGPGSAPLQPRAQGGARRPGRPTLT